MFVISFVCIQGQGNITYFMSKQLLYVMKVSLICYLILFLNRETRFENGNTNIFRRCPKCYIQKLGNDVYLGMKT